jgi:protein-disulfide isomerase
MSNLKFLVVILTGSLVLIFGIAFLFSQPEEAKTHDPLTVVGDARHATTSGLIGSTITTASQSATQTNPIITLVEFSDFQCPACQAASPLIQKIVDNHPDKVKLIFRHYPIESIHPNAKLAAQASEVAASYNQFWPYHHLLFQNQSEWANQSDPLPTFISYAKQLSIPEEEFIARIADNQIIDKIEKDIFDATTLQVNGTPTFFVNNQKVAVDQLETTISNIINNQ